MTRRHQSGLTLVATIFIVVIVASALALMQKIVATQTATLTGSIRSANAELAMHAGLEWGIYRVRNDTACPGGGSANFSLNGFDIVVTCSASTETEEGETITLYSLLVQASAGTFGQTDYVFRQSRIVVENQ